MSTATSTRRTMTVSSKPTTMQISHAGKKDPRMFTDGATSPPDRQGDLRSPRRWPRSVSSWSSSSSFRRLEADPYGTLTMRGNRDSSRRCRAAATAGSARRRPSPGSWRRPGRGASRPPVGSPGIRRGPACDGLRVIWSGRCICLAWPAPNRGSWHGSSPHTGKGRLAHRGSEAGTTQSPAPRRPGRLTVTKEGVRRQWLREIQRNRWGRRLRQN
jgi:hypothetical protein